VLAVRRLSLVTVSVMVALAVAVSAAAQGKSGSAPGHNKNKKSTPPSSSSLPGATSAAATASPLSTVTGASPLSWLDDASLLEPGSVLLTISGMRWSGADASEVDIPVVDLSFGLTKRVQLSASVPRVAGSADTGAVSGLGTSYFSGKIALFPDSPVKLAVSPLFEVLGTSAAQSLPEGESRYQFGLPVSIDYGRGPARLFGAAGFFTRGAWFAGGGAGFQLKPEMGTSVSFTRSWAPTDVEGVRRERSELSGGVSYFLSERIAVYGSLGHTIATTDENGAGMTVAAGVTFFFVPGGITK
jgi:hypothetical protein